MNYSIEITDNAENDLEEIVSYISTELLVPETAIAQLEDIETAILTLETFPERHPVIKMDGFVHEEIRQLLVNNYIVFYQISATTVFVLRVLYAKRDWLAIL